MHVMKNVPHPGEVFWELLPFNREVVHQPEGLLSIWPGDIMVLQMQHESIECRSDDFTMHAGLQQCMDSWYQGIMHCRKLKMPGCCSICTAALQLLRSSYCCCGTAVDVCIKIVMQRMASIQASNQDLSGCSKRFVA